MTSKPRRFPVLNVVREALSLLSPKQKLVFGLIVGMRLALNGLDVIAVAALGVLGAISAAAISGQDEISFLGYTLDGLGQDQALPILGAVLALFIAKALFSIFLTRRSAYFLARLEIDKSTLIARYLFSGRIDALHRYSKSEVQFSVTQSTSALFSGVLGGFATLIVESTLLISIFVLFILVDWIGAIGVFIYFAAIVVALQVLVSRKFSAAGKKITAGGIGAGETILEMFSLFRDIAVLGKTQHFLAKFEKTKKKQALASASIQVLNLVPKYFLETALIAGAIGFLVWQITKGDLEEALAALGVFLAGGARAIGAMVPIQSSINNLQVRLRQSELARKILRQTEKETETLAPNQFPGDPFGATEQEGGTPQPSGGFTFQVQDVTYTYPKSETSALTNISLEGGRNSYTAIIGQSGAGKSTLADLLLGLATPESGFVLVEGVSPVELIKQSPGSLGYVPQRPGLLQGSIAENIALGIPPELIDESRVLEVVELSQLSEVVNSLPQGIWTSLGKHANSLSGGQLQRIGLARALYTRPRLVVLDEATSALDAETESEIIHVIEASRTYCSFVVIAHRLSTIQRADLVCVLERGRVIAQGSFAEVRQKVPRIENYVNLMSFDG